MPATQTRPISINERPFDGSVFRVLGLYADYICGNSGHCCRQPWGINISDGEHRTMTRAMSESGLAADEIEKSFVSRKAKKRARCHTFGQNSNGHCRFIGEDGCGNSTCTAQRRGGHEVLPGVCQSYPRLAVRTPVGVYLTLFYTCPTTAKLLLDEGGLRETAPGKVFKWYPKLQGISFGPGTDPPTFVRGTHPD